MGVGARQPAEVSTLSAADAGDEKTHAGIGHRLSPWFRGWRNDGMKTMEKSFRPIRKEAGAWKTRFWFRLPARIFPSRFLPGAHSVSAFLPLSLIP